MPVFRTRIAEFRKEKGLTQAALADKVGACRETIGKIEGGQYNPSLKLAMDITGILGKTVEEVFILEDDGKPATEMKHGT